jgi:hypothetical protein
MGVVLCVFAGLAEAQPIPVPSSQLPPELEGVASTVRRVNCDAGQSINDMIRGFVAVANLVRPRIYVVEVSGTCNEAVTVFDFPGDFLVLDGMGTAILNGVSGSSQPTISIRSAAAVSIRNFQQINNSSPMGSTAIAISSCQLCGIGGSIISTSGGTAVQILGPGAVSIQGSRIEANTITEVASGIVVFGPSLVSVLGTAVTQLGAQTGQGVSAGDGSVVLVQGLQTEPMGTVVPTTVSGFTNGVTVLRGGSVTVGPFGAEIRGNRRGVFLDGGALSTVGTSDIMSNGMAGAADTGGIIATNASRVHVTPAAFGSPMVRNNTGHGILLSHNSHATIGGVGGPVQVTGNTGAGLTVANGSSVRVDGANNVTGNNAGVADVSCDASSLITGTSGLPGSMIMCANTNALSLPLP